MDNLIKVFASLGDSTRFAIVMRLMTNGPLPAGDLQDVADISAPAISRHLKVLREAGVISQTIDRQRRIYGVDPSVIETIHAWTLAHKGFWQGGEHFEPS